MPDAQLDGFIEADIIRFVENRLPAVEEAVRPDPGAPVLFLTRDYERELDEALDADEIGKAKRIIHDLKDRFDEAPAGTAEKSQIKTLLIALYERFRMRLEHDDDQDRTDVDIARLMRSWGIQPIESDGPDPLDALPVPKAPLHASSATRTRSRLPEAPAPLSEPVPSPVAAVVPNVQVAREEQGRELRERLINHAHELLDDVDRRLLAGDVRGAVHVYRATRRDVLAIEADVPDALARRFLATFDLVHDAIRSRAPKHKSPAVPAAPLPELPVSVPVPAPAPVSTPVAPAPLKAPEPFPEDAIPKILEPTPAASALPPLPKARPTTAQDRAAFDQAILEALDARKDDLDNALARNDLAAGMRAYDAMRTAALHLRDPARQSEAARKLRLLHGLLNRLRHATTAGDHALARTVP